MSKADEAAAEKNLIEARKALALAMTCPDVSPVETFDAWVRDSFTAGASHKSSQLMPLLERASALIGYTYKGDERDQWQADLEKLRGEA